MASLKSRFFSIANIFGSKLPFRLLPKKTGKRAILPLYHTVSDDPPPHIKNLYRIKSTREFEADLDFLLKYYEPVDLPGFLNNKPGKKNTFLLTFDDGLREFHDIAAPILLKKGIPAINFLNTDFIDNKGLFFRYKASLLIEHFKNKSSCYFGEWKGRLPLENREKVVSSLLSIEYKDRNLLDSLAEEAGLDFGEYLKEIKPYLTSEEVLSLMKKGFDFGAHSCDHPEYRFLGLEEQVRQTKESTEDISRKFQPRKRAFAFPFTDHGVGNEFFSRIHEKENIVDVSFGCAGLKDDPYPGHFQRIPMEVENLTAGEVLRNEYMYYFLLSAAGKNRIRRK